MAILRLFTIRHLSMVVRLGILLTLPTGPLRGVQSVTAATTSAVTGVEVVRSRIPPGTSADGKVIFAYCPEGKRVIGGGGRVYDGNSGKVMLTRLQPIHPAEGPDRFEVHAVEPDTGFSGLWTLQAFAICANATQLPGLEIVSSTTRPATSSTFKATALPCPGTKQVIGTGAGIENGGRQVGLQLSRASGPRDIARATAREDANGYSGSWALTSYAVCANPVRDATTEAYVDVTAPPTTNVFCPLGTRVHGAGGGGPLTDPGPIFLQAIEPSYTFVSVQMSGLPTNGMVAQAICIP